MGKYDVYLNDMQNYLKTDNDNLPLTNYYKNLLQIKQNDNFNIGGYNVFKIKVNGVEAIVKISSLNAQRGISIDRDEYKEVIFQNLDFPIYLGDIIEYNNLKWIVIITQKSNVGNGCTIRRCNIVLRFKDADGNKYDVPCAIKNTTDALLEKEQIITENDKLIGYVPFNDYYSNTKLISTSPKTRFIINGDVYYTYSLDNISDVVEYEDTVNNTLVTKGYLKITLKSDVFMAEDEFIDVNKFNGYATTIYKDNYELTINPRNLTLNIGDTQQLSITVKKNDINIDSNLYNSVITWNSSNNDVCTIDSTGKVTCINTGNCMIYCMLNNEILVKDSVSITVKNTNTSQKIIQIIGNSQILQGNKQTFIAKVYQNSVELTTESVTFSLQDISGNILSNTIGQIISSTNNSCVVIGNKGVNKAVLKAILNSDNTIAISKNIIFGLGW